MTEDLEHWIYVFSRVVDGKMTAPIKVGISKFVLARMVTIQTSCPFKIDLAYEFEMPNKDIAFAIEQSFHCTQRKNKTYGEWYNYEPIAAIHILCVAIRVALKVNIPDQSFIEPYLDKTGVLWAENKFGLAIPSGSTLQ